MYIIMTYMILAWYSRTITLNILWIVQYWSTWKNSNHNLNIILGICNNVVLCPFITIMSYFSQSCPALFRTKALASLVGQRTYRYGCNKKSGMSTKSTSTTLSLVYTIYDTHDRYIWYTWHRIPTIPPYNIYTVIFVRSPRIDAHRQSITSTVTVNM